MLHGLVRWVMSFPIKRMEHTRTRTHINIAFMEIANRNEYERNVDVDK